MLAEKYAKGKVLERFTENGKDYAVVKMPCIRCGGSGNVHSYVDNGICWQCHGAGSFIETVRDYTDVEYARMQRANETRRRHKEERMQVELQKRAEKQNLALLERSGFADVFAYAIIGDTFSIKEDLKAHGAKFTYTLLWVSPTEPTWLPSDRYVKISASDVFEYEDLFLTYKDSASAFIQSLQPTIGNYIGAVGSRITLQVTIERVVEMEVRYGFYPSTVYMHIMKNADGSTVIWKTQTVRMEEGSEHLLIGTVKEHSEYNGVKQTILTRCKEVTQCAK